MCACVSVYVLVCVRCVCARLTLEHGADLLEDGEAPDAEVLTERVLHEEQRHPDQQHHDDVRDQERACSETNTST